WIPESNLSRVCEENRASAFRSLAGPCDVDPYGQGLPVGRETHATGYGRHHLRRFDRGSFLARLHIPEADCASLLEGQRLTVRTDRYRSSPRDAFIFRRS